MRKARRLPVVRRVRRHGRGGHEAHRLQGRLSKDWTVQRPKIDASVLDDGPPGPEVAAAVGDISDQAQIIGRDGKPSGDGPYFGVGFDSKAGRREA